MAAPGLSLTLVGPILVGPILVGPTQVGPILVAPTLVGPTVVGPILVRPILVGPTQMGPTQVGSTLVGPILVGPILVGPTLVGPIPVGPTLTGPGFHGVASIAFPCRDGELSSSHEPDGATRGAQRTPVPQGSASTLIPGPFFGSMPARRAARRGSPCPGPPAHGWFQVALVGVAKTWVTHNWRDRAGWAERLRLRGSTHVGL